jgi:hypothetical protein
MIALVASDEARLQHMDATLAIFHRAIDFEIKTRLSHI